jgi:hypothetical protein
VTEAFPGASRRSKAARLVRILLAISNLRDLLLLHRALNLPGDRIFQGNGTRFCEDTLFLEKLIERRANMFVALPHCVTSFHLRLANSRSSAGVFCVFFKMRGNVFSRAILPYQAWFLVGSLRAD